MLWVLNRIICLDNFNAFIILISENQILKLSSAVVQPHLCSAKTFECVKALPIQVDGHYL